MNQSTAPTKLITLKDLCKLMSVKESWIRRHVFMKTIPFVKLGRLIRFDLEKILEWMGRNQTPNEKEYHS